MERNTSLGPFELSTGPVLAYRVGYQPDPFSWTPWEYANNGRFDGRWDDPDGVYRTLYVGESLLGCLLEVLADFRPDPVLIDELDTIDDSDGQDPVFPTLRGGTVPTSWLKTRGAGATLLSGDFVDIRSAVTLAALRTRFGGMAAGLGLPDLDAAAVKLSGLRPLTQAISSWCYRHLKPPVSGLCFASRFGDFLTLRATFERDESGDYGGDLFADVRPVELAADSADLLQAFAIHGLSWADG